MPSSLASRRFFNARPAKPSNKAIPPAKPATISGFAIICATKPLGL